MSKDYRKQKVEDLGHKFDMQNGVIINVSAWHWVKNNPNKQRAIILYGHCKDNYSMKTQSNILNIIIGYKNKIST